MDPLTRRLVFFSDEEVDEMNPPSDPECEQQKEEKKEVKGARLVDGQMDGWTGRPHAEFWVLFLSGQFWIDTIGSESCYRTEGEDGASLASAGVAKLG